MASPAAVRTRDGLTLHAHEWRPGDSPRANLILVHGIAEHAARHDHVARRFADAGIAVSAVDLRGFGRSGGRRAYLDRWSQYHDDVQDQLAAVRASSPGVPLILYGHSMGGLIALGYVLAEPRRPLPDVLVLSAPAIAATVPAWKRVAASVLGVTIPRFALANDFHPGSLSHDPQVDIAYRADPLATHRTTARLGAELLREQSRVQARIAQLEAVPLQTYVLHGDEDPIVPVWATDALGGKRNVTRRVYPRLRHETHNEPESQQVISDTLAFINRELMLLAPPRA
jgi:alpha-beta hydrolase superfamily lysophospholipase